MSQSSSKDSLDFSVERNNIMHFSGSLLVPTLLASSASLCAAASAWGFEDATVSVHGKKASAGVWLKEKYALQTPNDSTAPVLTCSPRLAENKPLSKPVLLGPTDSLKIILTTKDGSKATRPHQTFLNLKDTKSDLETSFALQLKESGKGKLELVSNVTRQFWADIDICSARLRKTSQSHYSLRRVPSQHP